MVIETTFKEPNVNLLEHHSTIFCSLVTSCMYNVCITVVTLFLFFLAELSALLSGNLSKVLEDYDASRCQLLYSDDALPHISSSRSDAVSIVHCTCTHACMDLYSEYMYMYIQVHVYLLFEMHCL